VTVSVFWNGLSGRKLPRLVSEWPSMWPVWTPVTEPATVRFPIALGAIPRKLIWVPGRLYLVPGLGYTETEGDAASAAAAPARASTTASSAASSRDTAG